MLETPTVCKESIKMLRTWKDAYYDTRLNIEKSGKEQKWEFDKNKLFNETDYIVAVASDLFDMAQVSYYIISFIHFRRPVQDYKIHMNMEMVIFIQVMLYSYKSYLTVEPKRTVFTK
jgi:hypothetical protein